MWSSRERSPKQKLAVVSRIRCTILILSFFHPLLPSCIPPSPSLQMASLGAATKPAGAQVHWRMPN